MLKKITLVAACIMSLNVPVQAETIRLSPKSMLTASNDSSNQRCVHNGMQYSVGMVVTTDEGSFRCSPPVLSVHWQSVENKIR